MIDGTFTYATLSKVAGYIYAELEEFDSELIVQLMPHRFVRGNYHGKLEGDGYIMDFKVDAKGLELQPEQSRERYVIYCFDSYQRLSKEFDEQAASCVHILDQSNEGELHRHFLFSDKMVLQQIHFKCFMGECRAFCRTDQSLMLVSLEKEKKMKRVLEFSISKEIKHALRPSTS